MRTVRCLENSVQTGSFTQPASPGTSNVFAIPGDFACPAQGFLSGRLTVELPATPLQATVDNPALPTVVTVKAPVPVVRAVASGSGAMLSQSESGHFYTLTAEIRGVTGCSATHSTTGRRGSPGSVNITATASCGLAGMRVTSQHMEGGRLKGFEARMQSRAHIVIGHDANPSRGGEYELLVSSYFQFGPDDELKLISVSPRQGERLDPLSEQEFEAEFEYELNSEDSAVIQLTLLDGDGNQIMTDHENVRRGTGRVTVKIPGLLPRRPELVLLRGRMLARTGDRELKRVADVVYPMHAEFTVDHMEVVQVTQDAANTVSLVERKAAVVRVFTKLLEAKRPSYRDVVVELHGFRGGDPLPGSPLLQQAGRFTRKSFNRNAVTDSHNFYVPLSWTDEGTVRFLAVVNPKGRDWIAEKEAGDNEKSQSFVFGPSQSLTIRYLRVCTKLPGEPRVCPSVAVSGHGGFVPKIYPVADGFYEYSPLDVPTFTWPKIVNRATREELIHVLTRRFQFFRATGEEAIDQLLAWLPFNHGENWIGTSDPKWNGGKGRVVLAIQTGGDDSKTVAHEVGHNMGLRHPATPDDTSWDPETDWLPRDSCGIQEPGFDVAARQLKPSTAFFDVMSYKPDSVQWIAPFHYLKLYRGHFIPRARAAAGTRNLLISGWANRDGTQARLDPLYPAVDGEPADDSLASGNYGLQFRGDDGELGEHCFILTFRDHETFEDLDEQWFVRTVAVPLETRRIALTRSGQELAVLTMSPNAPEVRFLTPQAGDEWSGGEQTVRWTGSDADGDRLVYSLLYSFDDGASWLPLTVDSDEAEFVLDPAAVRGGDAVRFKLLATDGVNSTEAEAGPVRIVQTPRAEVAQDRVDFLNVLLDELGERAVLLRSTGTGPLTVVSAVCDVPEFHVEFSGPFRLEAGGARPVPVRFVPTELGEVHGILTLRTDDPLSPEIEILLTGAGTNRNTPEIDASPTAFGFGNVVLGESRERTVSILNRGPAPLTLRELRTTHPAFVTAGLAEPLLLEAGAQHSVSVRFEPQEPRTLAAALHILSDDPEDPDVIVALEGTGVTTLDPVAGVAPGALNFGTVRVGTARDLTFEVTNSGGSPLIVLADVPAPFSIVAPGSPFTIDAGRRTVTVRFEPVQAGDFQGAVILSLNDPAQPEIGVTVTGTGTTIGPPRIEAEAEVLDFGRVATGQTKDLPLVIRNSGEARLHIAAIRSSSGRFTLPGAVLPAEIASRESKTFTVRFAPGPVAKESATLTVESNDPERAALTITVSGEGIAPVVPGGKGAVLFSDSFDRPNADRCLLGRMDNALGGQGEHAYLPLFPGAGGPANPVGIPLHQNELRNFGRSYAAVMFAAKSGGCVDTTVRGEALRSDFNIRAKFLLPGGVFISQGGLFVRGRALGRGESLHGEDAAGYWVQLHSTGEVKVQSLATRAPFATTGRPASFDLGAWHTLEVSVKGFLIEVAVDGKLQTFRQDGRLGTTVRIGAERHDGTAGIAVGAEDNENQIGGQRIDNLVVTEYDSLSALPLQNNFAAAP
ncbi:MAG: choice-of-anchor D domain-containing protein [Bryobacterales bacterium]|nr:choice-of-anchor D domain-containing protein [Bryobacterales bacterium]